MTTYKLIRDVRSNPVPIPIHIPTEGELPSQVGALFPKQRNGRRGKMTERKPTTVKSIFFLKRSLRVLIEGWETKSWTTSNTA